MDRKFRFQLLVLKQNSGKGCEVIGRSWIRKNSVCSDESDILANQSSYDATSDLINSQLRSVFSRVEQ